MKKYIIYFLTIILLIFVGINILILDYTKYIYSLEDISKTEVGLVLGASVLSNKRLSNAFKERLDATLELYFNQKINKILVSGDNRTKYYDEVNTAKKYLLENGVLEEDILLDHAGIKTFDSILRAKKVFNIDEAIIISQKSHLARALYIASELDLNAQGYSAGLGQSKREFFARLKAFLDVQKNIFRLE
ncbi:MAG: ElyC/SanA/YdcF family protein [Candidatus Pacebacteria bacterium]|jgi:SanA protein|nr:ElyC/SanA/YdcF family protein [Candidatus Paceibacterota bacterium]MDD2796383.1 ElyC/SanA/YdcF family protein [Candidatus Paceibacterota bacterium]MDD3048083.1 ElyC/SanA/YdcF family protein [Candidatus Paceibacterota bacterium]MDD3509836.1 ElyC/SanA/YdcF family protein [Candidatus Paceibacterota bacterium]MDD3918400.1 ElyC/SanA/YdcF family protein [Candidatus Paceibacterota bacterium]